jgi:hypothetical protein
MVCDALCALAIDCARKEVARMAGFGGGCGGGCGGSNWAFILFLILILLILGLMCSCG